MFALLKAHIYYNFPCPCRRASLTLELLLKVHSPTKKRSEAVATTDVMRSFLQSLVVHHGVGVGLTEQRSHRHTKQIDKRRRRNKIMMSTAMNL